MTPPPPATAQSPDDGDLLDRLRARAPGAFEALMRRYNRRLYRVARSLLGDAAEAEDAVQEAYIAAFRGLGNFRGDSSLATWLTRIVSNECAPRMRGRARRNNIAPTVPLADEAGEEGDPMPDSIGPAGGEPPERLLW